MTTAAAVSTALCCAVLAVLPTSAAADRCDPAIGGPGPSVWRLADNGNFRSPSLFDPVNGHRQSGFDFASTFIVNGGGYTAPGGTGCELNEGENVQSYPTITSGSVTLDREIYVDQRRPFGRSLDTVKNVSEDPITVEILYLGSFLPDFNIAASSDGNGTIGAADAWGSFCDDGEDDGCANVAGEGTRGPEVAFNWEGPGGDSADDADVFANGVSEIVFENVTVPPGKSRRFMVVYSLALSPLAATTRAGAIYADPRGSGVYRGLSRKTIRRLTNW